MLKVGDKKSCGCKTGEMIAKANTVHGHTWAGGRSPTNHSYKTMKSRSTNPNDPNYSEYGGRGIWVCDQWLGENGFVQFLKDMGERPEGTTLDRIDVNGGYCPENCRWADAQTQQGNRRNNIMVKIDGKSVCLAEAARIVGINENTLYGRVIRKGWPIDLALSTPAIEELVRDPITGQWTKFNA